MAARELFDYAIERGWMTRNPVRALGKLPQVEDRSVQRP
jgi:hypothetical protein